MSRTIGKIGKIAVSPVSAIIGDKATAAILAVAALIPGPHQPFAAAAATAFSVFAQMSAPKPTAKGSTTNVIIEAEPPRPYMLGESFSAGVLRHQVGYGATLKKVPNPYLLQVKVFSGVGPVESLVKEQFDFEDIGAYYTGFYDSDTQLGARPESTALVPPFGTAPGWGTASKLSGCAAIASNYKFDKDGKVFASGIPLHGAIWKGEKAYDPRLDSTYPGGSGAHRLDDETTWTYTANPALHAATYAYGRYENGIKIFGWGVSADAIDWEAVVDWANDCDTNTWEAHGTIFEGGPQASDVQKVRNMDDICAAGGARWIVAGALLSFDWHRPRVPVATLTDDDWLESGTNAIALQSFRDRMNGVRPQYVSPAHNWEQMTADEIISTTWRTEDGQPLTQTWPLNLVKSAAQAGQLATYAMADTREAGPIEINVGTEWRFYKPGETITLNSALLGYNGPAVIVQRDIDPATLEVKLTLKTETTGKHAYALGQTATPPPTPVLGQTGEERDEVIAGAVIGRGAFRIRTYVPAYPIAPAETSVAITAFNGTLEDGRTIAFPSDTITSLTASSFYSLFWHLIDEEYLVVTAPGVTQQEDSRYVFVGGFATSDGTVFPDNPTPPGGWNPDPNYQEP